LVAGISQLDGSWCISGSWYHHERLSEKHVATGSSTQIKQHKQMGKMMKKVSRKGGMGKLMRGMSTVKGKLSAGGKKFPLYVSSNQRTVCFRFSLISVGRS